MIAMERIEVICVADGKEEKAPCNGFLRAALGDGERRLAGKLRFL